MSKFDRITVVQKMKATGMVPVFYHPDAEVATEVILACYAGGVRAVEFTNRGDGAHKVFEQVMEAARVRMPELALGIGSVLDAGTASLYMQLGADFVVSPALVEEMAVVCNRRKVLWSPGCGSVSEIVRAHELGAELVKIFPGSEVGGPSFAQAVRGPMPWTQLMPTGGVSPDRDNLKAWFGAGVACVGMGSKLITKEVMMAFAKKTDAVIPKQLENKVRETLDLIADLRK